ncbi:hypothetical protein J2X07_002553 [Fictibacillus barbaricus]|uniref:Bacterial Pleckstrin homology domain-containing protein n=1 Tax=Fictibacillus barbaricus TaxID=182136 RepID=A0ABU1U2E3_9BACL|nr:hypothetical protein [Fictibacillus barbaricus]MDR7073566.1 hypothetical protein [Fictibacillus barbaricus]
MNKIKWIKRVAIGFSITLALIFALTYIPHKILSIEPTEVSKITIFDGNTGIKTIITDKNNINHIINNFNDVTFQKGKSSFGYMGYSFRTTIFDNEGKVTKEFTINSSDTIIYNGFFFKTKDNAIEYDYLEKLVSK